MVFFYHKEQKMRLTDDRYAGERSQFELALRMIRHEARTRTIRECTGLSDDRIRKLYARYFRNSGLSNIKRRRGKSPRQVQRYVKSPVNQSQATTLVALFCAGLLIRIDAEVGLDLTSSSDIGFAGPTRHTSCCTPIRNLISSGPGTCSIAFHTTTSCTLRYAAPVMLVTCRMPTQSTANSARHARLAKLPVHCLHTELACEKSEKLQRELDQMLKEFKEFAMRGNVVDMAVGIIIGAAFGKIVSSLVSDVIMPPVGVIMGSVSFSDLAIALGEGEGAATLNYGMFIDTVINFLIVALAVFFLIKGINSLKRKEEEKPAEPPKPSAEEALLTEIRDLLAKN
jgi:large conductance mechanosensitive channel